MLARAGVGPLSPVYLVAMQGLGGSVLGILFLTESDQALTGEAERWRTGLTRTLRVRGGGVIRLTDQRAKGGWAAYAGERQGGTEAPGRAY